MQLDR